MTLYLINQQGASEEYRDVSRDDAKKIIANWRDPENLTARLIDEGEVIYDGPSAELR